MKSITSRARTIVSALVLLSLLSAPLSVSQGATAAVSQAAAAVGAGYHALVIGNNDYKSLPKLKTAEADAREVAALLKDSYGFETRLLLNATRQQIVSALYSYRRALGPDSNLLVYYAGHGINDKEADKAYWLPVDADRDDPSTWISADDITTGIRVVPARHVLVISDSCYSGSLTRGIGESLPPPNEREQFLQRMMAGRSRKLMASGGDEPVADGGGGQHSVFAAALLKGLRGMGRERFTAAELFRYHVEEPVAGRARQTPEYNPLRNSGHESGDFVFVKVKTDGKNVEVTVKAPAAAPAGPAFDPAALDLAFWESIKNSADPEDYRAYLEKFPSGTYAALARRRSNPTAAAPAGAAETSKAPASAPAPAYTALITRANEAVTSRNYAEADRLFNEAALADPANPEPLEQLGKMYWERAFSADGSDLNKAEQAYTEAIRRGGKAVIRIYRLKPSSIAASSALMVVTITAAKTVFADPKGEYAYETDYKDVVAVAGEERGSLLNVYYPKESGKFFKATGKGKPNTKELLFIGYTTSTEDGQSIYSELYKLPGDERHSRLRQQALANIINAAQTLSTQTK